MNKITLHIDSQAYNQKPKNEVFKIKPRLQSPNTKKQVTLSELANFIEKGCCISPAVMKGGAKADNWDNQQLFLVDIDNDKADKPILTIEKALDICKSKKVPLAFYYESFSSSPNKPKFRLGFIADEVIKDTTTRYMIQHTLINLFHQSDTSCINADRIFYGTNKPVKIISEDTFTIESILKISTPKTSTSVHNKISRDNELRNLIESYDFLNYLISENGNDYKDFGNYIIFKNCRICKHHDNLVYYKGTNTFKCFSSKGGACGSVIDYIMATQNLDLLKAISYFKYDLCHLPKKEFSKSEKRDFAIAKKHTSNKHIQENLKELKAEESSLDDKSTSRLFAEVYKNICRYCPDMKTWYVFNGLYWEKGDMLVKELCKSFKDEMVVYISQNYKISNPNNPDEEQKKTNTIAYYNKLGSRNKRDNIILDAQSVFPIKAKDFDTNNLLFNCLNGTLNLKTKEFYPHKADDLLTKISNVFYDPNNTDKTFQNFVSQIMEGNIENIQYIQKILGLSLTGDTPEECFFLFFGKPRSGKSTLSTTFSYMLGDDLGYAMTIQPESLAQKKFKSSGGANSDIARLKGCRFLVCNEPSQDMQLDVAQLKSFTGRDILTARFLYGEYTQFIPSFKLVIVTNYLPHVSDDTLFTSNRVNVIPFNFYIEEIDTKLKEKLKSKDVLAGAFNWCLEGLDLYLTEGLQAPPDVVLETDKYNKNGDTVTRFIKEKLDYTRKLNTSLKKVFEAYQDYCFSNNLPCDQKSIFTNKLRARRMIANNLTAVDTNHTERNVVTGYVLKE